MDPQIVGANGICLREWQESDLDSLSRIYADTEVERFMMFPTQWGREQQMGYVERMRSAWEEDNPRWAVADQSTGALVGGVGVTMMTPGEATIMFFTGPEARARGIATTACREAARFAFEKLAVERLCWEAMVGNHYSRLVAAKVGFVFEGMARRGGYQRGKRYDQWRASLLPGELLESDERPPNYEVIRAQAQFFASTHDAEVNSAGNLRRFQEGDFHDRFLAFTDGVTEAKVQHFHDIRMDTASDFICLVENRWIQGIGIDYALTGRSNRYCGEVSLTISADNPMNGQVRFFKAPWESSQQVVSAAVNEICLVGFKKLYLDRIEICVANTDEQSKQIVKKAGFEFEGTRRRRVLPNGSGPSDVRVASRLSEPNIERQYLAIGKC